MKPTSNRIIISTESVNEYRFRVLTKGIDISQYKKNPIMLWMHERSFGGKYSTLPLGNVVDLKVENLPDVGLALTGQPMFDENDQFAMQIFSKMEAGIIRMASAGLRPKLWSDDTDLQHKGQTGQTLIKSELAEVSIVDIGANNDALSIALYDKNKQKIELSLESENAIIPVYTQKTNKNMKKVELSATHVAGLLGLNDTDNPNDFEAKINDFVKLSQRQATEIERLKKENAEEAEKVSKLTNELQAEKTIQLKAKAEELVKKAIEDRKITADVKDTYVSLALKDYESVEKLLNSTATSPTVQSLLEKNSPAANKKLLELCAKSYDDLHKNDELAYVKANAPEEYKRIYEEKFPQKK